MRDEFPESLLKLLLLHLLRHLFMGLSFSPYLNKLKSKWLYLFAPQEVKSATYLFRA